MNDISYVDETFDFNFTSEYHLSIQAGLDGFSFCILDTIQKKYVLLKHHSLAVNNASFLTGKIKDIYKQEEILGKHFKSVSITYADYKSTIIPIDYLREENAEKIIYLNQISERNEVAESVKINSFKQAIVYSCPTELRSFFDSHYSNYKFYPATYTLLNAAIQQKGKSAKTLIVNFRKKHFHTILIQDDIQLYNSFYYKTESDFLYHCLNICKKLDFDVEKDEMLVSGDVGSDSEFIRSLKKYVLNIKFLKPDHDFNYSYTFGKTPSHYFAELFNSYQCEL